MGQLTPTPPPPPYPPPAAQPQAPFGPTYIFVPAEVAGGFNWGAFWWTWIWGIAHNVWIALLAFVVPWPIMNLVLALKGNEWAWQNRRFESIEQFRATQGVWSLWGWIVFGVGTLLVVLLFAFGIGAAILAAMAGAAQQ